MHSDEGPADIDSGIRFLADRFYGDRILKTLIGGRGKRASRLGLGNHIDLFESVQGTGLPLKDQGAAKVFTALGSKINSFLLQNLINPCKKRARRVHAGMTSDLFSKDLTRGTSDHEQISFFEFCAVTDFCGCLIRLPADYVQLLTLYTDQFHIFHASCQFLYFSESASISQNLSCFPQDLPVCLRICLFASEFTCLPQNLPVCLRICLFAPESFLYLSVSSCFLSCPCCFTYHCSD